MIEKARRRPARIVYPEGTDPRIIAAAVRVRREGIAEPILVGDPERIAEVSDREQIDLESVRIVSPNDPERIERYAQEYSRRRDRKLSLAKRLVKKPLAFGGMMVCMGDADGMVAGADSPTATVIMNATLTIGLKQGFSIPSSFFVMVLPEFEGRKNAPLLFADCGVTIDPDAGQLAEIGVATGQSARALLGLEPAVAFLSFSTKGSASHASVDKVKQAVSLARELAPDMTMDGELQADAALIERVAAKKVGEESAVAGKANTLVFPDLNSGNIAYKLVQYLAQADAIGPILQGFAHPVCDLSRGASIEDIVNVTAITVVQAQAPGSSS
jgi:phosphate acetyltransferase